MQYIDVTNVKTSTPSWCVRFEQMGFQPWVFSPYRNERRRVPMKRDRSSGISTGISDKTFESAITMDESQR